MVVKIRFSPKQALYIQERKWCTNQDIEKCADGSLHLTQHTSGWSDVKKWILSFGADAELLEPEDKRKEIMEEISRTAELYRSD